MGCRILPSSMSTLYSVYCNEYIACIAFKIFGVTHGNRSVPQPICALSLTLSRNGRGDLRRGTERLLGLRLGLPFTHTHLFRNRSWGAGIRNPRFRWVPSSAWEHDVGSSASGRYPSGNRVRRFARSGSRASEWCAPKQRDCESIRFSPSPLRERAGVRV